MLIVQPSNLLFLNISFEVDNMGERTVFMTWLSWGVEGISISSSSASDLSGEVRLSFAGTVSTVSALLVMGNINALDMSLL